MGSVAFMGLIILGLGYLLASLFYPMLSGGAGYTPTPRRRVAEALELVGLKREDVFYDLGCGTGGGAHRGFEVLRQRERR